MAEGPPSYDFSHRMKSSPKAFLLLDSLFRILTGAELGCDPGVRGIGALKRASAMTYVLNGFPQRPRSLTGLLEICSTDIAKICGDCWYE